MVAPPSGLSWRVAAVEAVPRLDALPAQAVLLGAPAGPDPPADGGSKGAAGVVDLVSMTGDTSDYCWYVRSVPVPAMPASAQSSGVTATLSVVAADIVYAYVNGTYVGSSPAAGVPLWEDRFPNKWNAYDDGRGWPGWTHIISFPWAAAEPAGATVEVALLAVSTGMVKGDWQLGGGANMLDERKGVLSPPTLTVVAADAATVVAGTDGGGGAPVAASAAEAGGPHGAAGWTAVPFLSGEVACVGDAEPHRRRFLGQPLDAPPPPLATPPPTVAASPSPIRHLPTWHTAAVTAPAVSDGWFLDMGGLTRGALYVNGHHLARYWTVAGVRGLNGFLDGSPMGVGLATVAVTAGIEKDVDGHGSPGGGAPAPPSTQRYYHVPPWVVTDSDAARVTLHVTILDEGGARPDTVALYDSAMEAVEGGHGTSAFAPRG